MKKRIRNKIYNKKIKELENKAMKKFKQRYGAFMVKNGLRKGDIIIPGLEDWKIQLEYCGEEPSIIMHPYSIIDTFKYGEAYVSIDSIDDNLFNLLDNIIANKEYHIGCAWEGESKTQEEGLRKYSNYIESYKKHSNEVKNIKLYIENYLEGLSKNDNIKEIIMYRSKNYIYQEKFGVFIFAKKISECEYEKLNQEISKAFNIKKCQPKNEIRSKLLLPGKGVSYKYAGIFMGKDENEYRKRLGKDIYKSIKYNSLSNTSQ